MIRKKERKKKYMKMKQGCVDNNSRLYKDVARGFQFSPLLLITSISNERKQKKINKNKRKEYIACTYVYYYYTKPSKYTTCCLYSYSLHLFHSFNVNHCLDLTINFYFVFLIRLLILLLKN